MTDIPENVPPVTANHIGQRMGAILAEHDPGPEYAVIECAHPEGCRRRTRIDGSAGRSDADLAAEFAERGWTVGPTRCPEHRVIPPGERSMNV